MKAPPSRSNYLPYAPSPRSIALRIRDSTYDFWEDPIMQAITPWHREKAAAGWSGGFVLRINAPE